MKSIFIEAPDGASLHVAHWESEAKSKQLPVVCLAGVTRNYHDFKELAKACETRDVYALDYRGRGLSAWNEAYEDYGVPQEQSDILHCLEALNITQAVFIGTSRGGIHTMLLAAMKPDLIAASVLNDIGAELELKGLLKIQASLDKRSVQPNTYNEAVAVLKTQLEDEFPTLSYKEWDFLAKTIWFKHEHKLVPSMDGRLKDLFKGVTADTKLQAMWQQFALLAQRPCFIIRGENSQLFSSECYDKMRNYNEFTTGYEVLEQGHAPIMMGVINEEIVRFLKGI